jgi:membrane dipeptidase
MSQNDPDPSDRADRLHHEALVFDGHADTIIDIADKGLSFEETPTDHHVDFPRIRKGGLDAEFFTAFVDPEFLTAPRERAARLIDALHVQAESFPDRLKIAGSAVDVEEAVATGRCAAIPAIEGGHAIEDSLDHLREFHRLGVRLMTLTWNNSNNWAEGCFPGPNDPRPGGLTELGRRIVGEMERLGIIVDISHASPATFRDVERIATKPFVASHSCAAALVNHARNLTDGQLRSVARHGGLVGVCFASSFLFDEISVWEDVRRTEEYERLPVRTDTFNLAHMAPEEAELYERLVPRATLDDLFRHIDHLVGIMGRYHVALGTDFDGIKRLPAGIRDVSDLPRVTEGLVARGYDDETIRLLLGGNWMRVLKEVTGS